MGRGGCGWDKERERFILLCKENHESFHFFHEHRKNIYTDIFKTKQKRGNKPLRRPNAVRVDTSASLEPWAGIAAEARKPLREKMQDGLRDQKSNFSGHGDIQATESYAGIT